MSTKKNDDDLLDALLYAMGGSRDYDTGEDLYPSYFDWDGPIFTPKCECGAESIGVNKHSQWCPKEIK